MSSDIGRPMLTVNALSGPGSQNELKEKGCWGLALTTLASGVWIHVTCCFRLLPLWLLTMTDYTLQLRANVNPVPLKLFLSGRFSTEIEKNNKTYLNTWYWQITSQSLISYATYLNQYPKIFLRVVHIRQTSYSGISTIYSQWNSSFTNVFCTHVCCVKTFPAEMQHTSTHFR